MKAATDVRSRYDASFPSSRLGDPPKLVFGLNIKDRNRAIWRLRDMGLTYRRIGDQHGITVERVRQIIWKMMRQKLREKEGR